MVLQDIKVNHGCVSGKRETAHTSKDLSKWLQNVGSSGKEGDPDGIDSPCFALIGQLFAAHSFIVFIKFQVLKEESSDKEWARHQ